MTAVASIIPKYTQSPSMGDLQWVKSMRVGLQRRQGSGVHLVYQDLYSFPLAVVTNYHKPKEYQFIIIQSGGEKFKISLTGIKSRHQQGWFLLETLRDTPFACLL